MDTDVREFLAYVGSEKGCAKNTVLAYEQDLEQYSVFCIRRKVDYLHVTLKDLRDFLASMRKQNLASRSMARKISTVKQFYKFLLREDKVTSDPSELLTVIVKTKKLPKHLTHEEIIRLVTAPKGDSEQEIRDRALLEMWYATGVRVTELAEIRAEKIDWEQGLVEVFGKGGRARLVPMHQEAIQWCKKYKDIRHEWMRRNDLKEMEVFFLSSRGKGFTRQGIWKILKKYAKRAGISRNVWPHMIRHTFATHILQGGADLRAVQELLGHRSIATTEVYTHLDIENLKLMQIKYHPRG